MWWRCSPPFKEQTEVEAGSNEYLERLGLRCSFGLTAGAALGFVVVVST